MSGLLKVIIFLIVFAGTTAAISCFIIPDGQSVKKSDISISKALSLAIGFLIAVIVLFVL